MLEAGLAAWNAPVAESTGGEFHLEFLLGRR
jgi:hypothetical protein